MAKRHRLMALKEKAKEQPKEQKPLMGIGECDIGASPVATKATLFGKKKK